MADLYSVVSGIAEIEDYMLVHTEFLTTAEDWFREMDPLGGGPDFELEEGYIRDQVGRDWPCLQLIEVDNVGYNTEPAYTLVRRDAYDAIHPEHTALL